MRPYYIIICLFLLFLIPSAGQAQQTPFFSTYIYHPEYYNPAALGSGHITAIYRRQWLDFEGTDAPTTYAVYADLTPYLAFSERVGLGVNVTTDRAHVFSRNLLDFSMAYHLYRSGAHRFSLGVLAGVLNQRLDFDRLATSSLNDLSLYSGAGNGWAFDAGPGFFYQYKTGQRDFSVSLTLPQLFSSDINYGDDFQLAQRFDNRFHLLAGARYRMKLEVVELETSALFRGINGIDQTLAKSTLDVNARVFFMDNLFWIGGGARLNGNTYLMGFGSQIGEQMEAQCVLEYHTQLRYSAELAFIYRLGNGKNNEEME